MCLLYEKLAFKTKCHTIVAIFHKIQGTGFQDAVEKILCRITFYSQTIFLNFKYIYKVIFPSRFRVHMTAPKLVKIENTDSISRASDLKM